MGERVKEGEKGQKGIEVNIERKREKKEKREKMSVCVGKRERGGRGGEKKDRESDTKVVFNLELLHQPTPSPGVNQINSENVFHQTSIINLSTDCYLDFVQVRKRSFS